VKAGKASAALAKRARVGQTALTIAAHASNSETRLLRSETDLLRSETDSPRSETRLLRSETDSPRSETRLLRSETDSPRSETRLRRKESGCFLKKRHKKCGQMLHGERGGGRVFYP
jgi:hypothetical protein